MSSTSDSKSAAAESQTYGRMLEEVETICKDLTAPELDLDQMVGKVERGYSLIKAMRLRLEETRQKVEHLRVELE